MIQRRSVGDRPGHRSARRLRGGGRRRLVAVRRPPAPGAGSGDRAGPCGARRDLVRAGAGRGLLRRCCSAAWGGWRSAAALTVLSYAAAVLSPSSRDDRRPRDAGGPGLPAPAAATGAGLPRGRDRRHGSRPRRSARRIDRLGAHGSAAEGISGLPLPDRTTGSAPAGAPGRAERAERAARAGAHGPGPARRLPVDDRLGPASRVGLRPCRHRGLAPPARGEPGRDRARPRPDPPRDPSRRPGAAAHPNERNADDQLGAAAHPRPDTARARGAAPAGAGAPRDDRDPPRPGSAAPPRAARGSRWPPCRARWPWTSTWIRPRARSAAATPARARPAGRPRRRAGGAPGAPAVDDPVRAGDRRGARRRPSARHSCCAGPVRASTRTSSAGCGSWPRRPRPRRGAGGCGPRSAACTCSARGRAARR